MTRVLIVDDELPIRLALERILAGMNYEVVTAADGLEAQARLAQLPLDLVITDLSMPNADGFEVLRAVRELRSALPVIVLTGHVSTADCVRAMRAGAADFIGKPFDQAELQQIVRAALRSGGPSDSAAGGARLPQAALVGDSPQMQSVIEQVERVAHNDVTVLLIGEQNTGKQATARLLHAMSSRAGKPLIAFKCAGSDLEQLEDKLASAEGGTLLLTEIEQLDEARRDQLTRALVARVAVLGNTAGRANVRVVLSIDLEPASEHEANALASALQEQLDGVLIAMPPLRERVEDLPLLVEYFTEVANRRAGRSVKSDTLVSAFQRYSWPGNISELEERITRYVTDAPPERPQEQGAAPHAFVVPIQRITSLLILNDGTRHEVVFPLSLGQPIEELFEALEPFVPVNEAGRTKIYARAALACVAVRDAAEIEDDGLPRKTRSVRVQLLSGVTLEGELRYVAVEGRGRVTDVLNESSPSFALYASSGVHHIAKAHVLCIEES